MKPDARLHDSNSRFTPEASRALARWITGAPNGHELEFQWQI
jgi:hypothetical protein